MQQRRRKLRDEIVALLNDIVRLMSEPPWRDRPEHVVVLGRVDALFAALEDAWFDPDVTRLESVRDRARALCNEVYATIDR